MAGCRGGGSARHDASGVPVVRQSASGAAPSVPAVPSAGAAEVIDSGPGQFTVRAHTPIKLATEAHIEARAKDGSWTAYPGLDGDTGYRLVDSCASTPSPCRSLSAGEQLVLVPWSGTTCSAQCAAPCPADDFHPGTHRLVVHGCEDPSLRYEGPAFEMPASAAMLARRRAASESQRAVIVRLDPRDVEGADRFARDRVAGFRVRAEPEQPVAAEVLTGLATWLRSSSGFNDKVVRRCARKHMVGFVLQGATMPGSTGATEMAADFACNSLIVVRTEQRGRIETWSHFDASRSELLALVRRALPQDQELAALR
ncbi:MAG: hypothetical protein JW940_33720 [Polyangiaceae bacterium]|nr:hypothetical protein [Polyangiaceae bacterium]